MKKLFDKYACYYDFIYADKNYGKECDFVEAIIKVYHALSSSRKILDIGCGSGSHAVILAKRGYQMTGIDLSEAMISKAKERGIGLDINFQLMDMTELSLSEKFDICICLFCGIGYLPDNDALENTLKRIKGSLRPGGLFIFDFWNGIAVTSQRPSVRVKDIKYGDHGRIIRIAEPELDLLNQVCNIKYRFLVMEKERLMDEFEEIHPNRYFFPREIEGYLKNNGFRAVKIYSYPNAGVSNYDFKLDPSNWYLMAIAKAG